METDSFTAPSGFDFDFSCEGQGISLDGYSDARPDSAGAAEPSSEDYEDYYFN